MSRTTKSGPMCVVNIGFHCELLMPADKGMKLVALLQDSLLVRLDYQGTSAKNLYVSGDLPEVNYTSVKPDQVVMPQATVTTPRRKGPLLSGND